MVRLLLGLPQKYVSSISDSGGSATRARTWDILLNREALYRLSYRGMLPHFAKASRG